MEEVVKNSLNLKTSVQTANSGKLPVKTSLDKFENEKRIRTLSELNWPQYKNRSRVSFVQSFSHKCKKGKHRFSFIYKASRKGVT